MPERQTTVLTLVEKTALQSVFDNHDQAEDNLRRAHEHYVRALEARKNVVRDILAVYGYGPDDELETTPKELTEGRMVHFKRNSKPAQKEDDGTKGENSAP